MEKKTFSFLTLFIIVASIIAVASLWMNIRSLGVTPSAGSGVRGIATTGPTCPVERIPPDPNCADKPYPAELIILASNGTMAAHLTAGKDGTFEKELSPGIYTIGSFNDGKVYPRTNLQTFTVHAGVYTEITMRFDSGIR